MRIYDIIFGIFLVAVLLVFVIAALKWGALWSKYPVPRYNINGHSDAAK